MNPPPTILIVGGYGTFGGRIVELLEADAGVTLIVAGRSTAKAEAFCRSRPGATATLRPAAFDRGGDIDAQIAKLRPDILIDASGPFQAYGGGRYRVIEGCIAAGVNYLDLADGSQFVAGVKAYDDAARAAGVYVLSGASSVPALSAAAVRRLSRGLRRVDGVRGGIAPSPYARVGANVVRAIASYCGQPVRMKTGTRETIGYPFTEQVRYTIAPPGRLPLANRLFSLVDVPDLQVLSELWPEAREIWFGAGTVPEILHRCLIALAWLVRWRLVGSLTPIAGLMNQAANTLRWGERRGGMFVEIVGQDERSSPVTRSWHLLVEGDDGPLIPSMASAAIVRGHLAGRPPAPGARAATRDLELEDYEAFFAGRAISTGLRDDSDHGASLYRRLLGSAYDALPAEIQALHDATAAEGQASVEHGSGLLARLVATAARFPTPTPQTPVRVTFGRIGASEIWSRLFGEKRFCSEQFEGVGRSDRLLVERFGRLDFSMALVVGAGRLSLRLRRWTVCGVPMPFALAPRIEAFESVESGRFRFNVEIGHPLTGLIVRYRGWLKPAAPADAEQQDPS